MTSNPQPSGDDALRAAMDQVRGLRKLPTEQRPLPAPVAQPAAHPEPETAGAARRRFWDIRGRVADDLARVATPSTTAWPRPLAGLIAGLWSALMSWLVFAGIMVIGWVFAPLGSGSFSDVMRASGGSWLVADGGAVIWQKAQFSLMPLLATFVVLLFQRRAGTWLATAVDVLAPRNALSPMLYAVIAAASAQAIAAATIANTTLSVPLWRSVAGSAVVAVVGFGWGIARSLAMTAPAPIRPALLIVRRFGVSMLLLATLAVGASAIAQRTAFAEVLGAVAGDTTSTVQVILLCALYVPTMIGWSLAFLLGPGFSLGTGTAVAVTGVQLSVLPPIPLLALVPESLPAEAPLALLLPLVLALWATRSSAPVALGTLLVTVAGGFAAGAFAALAVSGGFGPGRLMMVGPAWWQVGLACSAWLSAGFLFRKGWAYAWSRMREARESGQDDAGKLEA